MSGEGNQGKKYIMDVLWTMWVVFFHTLLERSLRWHKKYAMKPILHAAMVLSCLTDGRHQMAEYRMGKEI